ncbi:SUMO-activating enzyme subunit 2, partial [Linum perenne]
MRYAFLDYKNFDTIPFNFFDGLDIIQFLSLDHNLLNKTTGWRFPVALARAGQLTNLSMMSCNLVDPLPEFLGALPLVESLKLSYNNLTGKLPSIFRISLMSILWLNNQQGGRGLTDLELDELDLNNKKLMGSIPKFKAKNASYNLQKSIIGNIVISLVNNVSVHMEGRTDCYECNPKPATKTYPVCTITSTPSKLCDQTHHQLVLKNQQYRFQDKPIPIYSRDISTELMHPNGNSDNEGPADDPLSVSAMEIGNLSFDKDDPLVVQLVTTAGNIRVASFGIALHSLFEAKGIAGNGPELVQTKEGAPEGAVLMPAGQKSGTVIPGGASSSSGFTTEMVKSKEVGPEKNVPTPGSSVVQGLTDQQNSVVPYSISPLVDKALHITDGGTGSEPRSPVTKDVQREVSSFEENFQVAQSKKSKKRNCKKKVALSMVQGSSLKKKSKALAWKLVLSCVWKERCNRVFTNDSRDVDTI